MKQRLKSTERRKEDYERMDKRLAALERGQQEDRKVTQDHLLDCFGARKETNARLDSITNSGGTGALDKLASVNADQLSILEGLGTLKKVWTWMVAIVPIAAALIELLRFFHH